MARLPRDAEPVAMARLPRHAEPDAGTVPVPAFLSPFLHSLSDFSLPSNGSEAIPKLLSLYVH